MMKETKFSSAGLTLNAWHGPPQTPKPRKKFFEYGEGLSQSGGRAEGQEKVRQKAVRIGVVCFQNGEWLNWSAPATGICCCVRGTGPSAKSKTGVPANVAEKREAGQRRKAFSTCFLIGGLNLFLRLASTVSGEALWLHREPVK